MQYFIFASLWLLLFVRSDEISWRLIHPRIRSSSKFSQKYEFHPTPRKGASAVNIAGKIYVFGGFAELPTCETNDNIDKENCNELSFEYSNELWKFDPLDSTWELLKAKNGIQPEGREQHSAAVLSDNRMLIFGGRKDLESSYNGTSSLAYFSDAWLLDMGRITTHIFQNDENIDIPEGKYSSNILNVSIEGNDHVGLGDLCVDDVKVKLSISHPCTKQLSLKLYGPQGEEAELFPLNTDSRCLENITEIIFSDKAKYSIIDDHSTNPFTGEYKPVQPLMFSFKNSMINGKWKLEVYDAEVDLVNGSILNWELELSSVQCTTTYKWKNISPSGVCTKVVLNLSSDGNAVYTCVSDTIPIENEEWPSARYGHTSIVVNDSVFIVGGYAGRSLNDIWRYDYKLRSWVQLLNSHLKSPVWSGRSAVLAPDGLYVIGGINGMNDKSFLENDLMKFDFSTSTWMLIGHHKDEYIFSPRYQSTLTLIGLPELDSTRFTFPYLLDVPRRPTLLLFGGNPGYPTQSYLNDIWALQLPVKTSEDVDKDIKLDRCKTLIDFAYMKWNETCGISKQVVQEKSSTCHWMDIASMAWCLDQYQSFTSPV